MLKLILSLILTSSLTWGSQYRPSQEWSMPLERPSTLTWGSQYGLSQERQIIDVTHAIRQLQEIETGDAGSLDDFLASLLRPLSIPSQEEFDRRRFLHYFPELKAWPTPSQEEFDRRRFLYYFPELKAWPTPSQEEFDRRRYPHYFSGPEASPIPSQEELDRALAQNILGQSASGILEGLERWYATTIDRPSVYYREGATVYVPRSGRWGRILTIDERRGMATVELDRWGRNTQETLLLRELAVASGCLKEGELCIGQRVYTTSGKWNQHTIEAIDYYGNRVVVKRRGISIVSPDELLLRHGCLERTHGENFCVGSRFTVQRRGRRRHSYTSRIEIVAIGKSILLVRYPRSGEEDRREFLRPNQLDRMILSHGHH